MRTCSDRPDAVARVRGGPDAPCLSGEVQFYQKSQGVLVIANISGLPQGNNSGFFALHIHEGGSCCGEGFSDTGSHYNPFDAPHPGHAGDLPPLLRQCNGEAHLAVQSDRFCIKNIIGRTIVIHSGSDDFKSQPAGNAGTKIACGVICEGPIP